MSFAYSSGVITQTGTDTDLSGLSGLTNVVETTNNGRSTYDLTTSKLIVNGTLETNPEIEKLILSNCGTNRQCEVNGTLSLGKQITSGGFTRTTKGTVFENWNANGLYWYNYNGGYASIYVASKATLNIYGATVMLSSQGMYWHRDSFININEGVIVGEGQGASVEPTRGLFLFVDSNNININTLTLAKTIEFNVRSSLGSSTISNIITEQSAYGLIFDTDASIADYIEFESTDVALKGNYVADYALITATSTSDSGIMKARLRNAQLGTEGTYKSDAFTGNRGRGILEHVKDINFAVQDTEGASTDMLLRIEYGNTTGLLNTTSFGGRNYTTLDFEEVQTSGGSGQLSITTGVLADIVSGGSTPNIVYTSNSNSDADDYTIKGISYESNILSLPFIAKGKGAKEVNIIAITDTNISESTRATVDAYTELETPEKFYDAAKAYLVDNYAGEIAPIVSRDGNSINAGSYDVVVDASASSVFAISGNTLTIKATTFVGNIATTGTTTLSNGAKVIGTFGTTTVLPWTVKNVEGTSRIQLVNVTQSNTEVVNTKLTSSTPFIDATGTYDSSEIAEGDVVRLRVTCVVGATALLPVLQTGVATSTGITFQVDQEADTVYNSNGINGSTVSTLTADYTNPMGVDISDADGTASVKEIYAFFTYSTTTADGVDKWFGGMRAIDNANYEVVTANADIKIQNIGNNAVVVSDGRMYRDDGGSILYAEDGDKPIVMDSGALVTSIQPQVEAGLNANAKISSINNNSKLIPSLL